MDNTFICFSAKTEHYFLIPLLEVEKIISCNDSFGGAFVLRKEDSEKLPIIDFCKKKTPDKEINVSDQKENADKTVIVINNKKKMYGIAVDKVKEIIKIEPENQFEIPAMVRDLKNQFLAGVCYWKEKGRLCYLLDSSEVGAYL